ncbi:MAG TPA: radical SAM protein [Polyangiaceae bacterium]|nr:radical SAM protein [Polyangiaceae bacterium]
MSRAADLVAAGPDALARRLEACFAAHPELRPDRQLHDYQLTYPPAVAIEQPEHARRPADDEYRARALGGLRDAGLYVHFGFCAYRCRYCFHYELKVRADEGRMGRYVEALVAEARALRALAPGLRQCLTFLGGGTPTALPERLIRRFVEGYAEAFGRAGSALSTVEAKPVTATEEKLRAYAEGGFRRVNFGVQTLDPALYAFHHHGEDVAACREAIGRARRVGYDWVNVDLMCGLERETPASWALTLRTLGAWAREGLIDSVFLYPFHDDPRSRTFRAAARCPDFARTAFAEAEYRALLESLGWLELGPRFFRSPSHVACEAREALRLGAVPAYGDSLYLGLGNSSFSVGESAAYLNTRDVDRYVDAVAAGGLPISHFVALTPAQKAARDLTFSMLYAPFVDLGKYRRKYGPGAVARHEERLRAWSNAGLGSIDRLFGIFVLSPLGKLVHQQMLAALYLPEDAATFRRVMLKRKEAGAAYRGYLATPRGPRVGPASLPCPPGGFSPALRGVMGHPRRSPSRPEGLPRGSRSLVGARRGLPDEPTGLANPPRGLPAGWQAFGAARQASGVGSAPFGGGPGGPRAGPGPPNRRGPRSFAGLGRTKAPKTGKAAGSLAPAAEARGAGAAARRATARRRRRVCARC